MDRWPRHNAYFWETAPFFRILLPFAAGILLYNMLPFGTWGLGVTALCSVVLIVMWGFNYCLINHTLAKPVFNFLLVSSLLVCGGYAISWFSDIRNNAEWFGNHLGGQKSYLVSVIDEPVQKERTYRLNVTVLFTNENGRLTPAKGNAFLYIYKEPGFFNWHKGDSLIVPGNWQRIKNAGNPFEFDYAGYCRRNNILYQQFCAIEDVQLFSRHNPVSTPLIDKVHDWCMAQLDRFLPDKKTKGLLQAMILGDEINLYEDLRRSYTQTGIVHIIAISGGNVALFFLIISACFSIFKNRKYYWLRYFVAIPLVWFYVIMAGASPSAIRAAIMFSLVAGGIMFQKNNNSLNHLLATAFLLLCVQPMWLFSVGFQLSVVAVLSLILFYNWVLRWYSPKTWIFRKLWSAVAASLAAEILVAPLVIYYFHIFPVMFVVANVAAYLFMGIVLVLGMLIIFVSSIPLLASIIGKCTIFLVGVFDSIVLWLQKHNPDSFYHLSLTGLELFLLYLVLGCSLYFIINRNKKAMFAASIAACIFVSFLCYDQWMSAHQHRLIVYNAGRANHIELTKGAQFSVLYTDTSATNKIEYATAPAHIGWHAWHRGNYNGSKEFFLIGNKKVLILNAASDTNTLFPVDYLIINYIGKLNPIALKKMFSPSKVVIGNNYPVYQQEKLKQQFNQEGVQVHCVALDGAFIVSCR